MNNENNDYYSITGATTTTRQMANVESRLRPQCITDDEYLLVFIVDTEQNLVRISAVLLVVFFCRWGIYTCRAIGPLCENMTSFTKPEVHNVLQRLQRRTEPWYRQHAKKFWWRSAVWFSSYASKQTDEQMTNISQYATSVPGRTQSSKPAQ